MTVAHFCLTYCMIVGSLTHSLQGYMSRPYYLEAPVGSLTDSMERLLRKERQAWKKGLTGGLLRGPQFMLALGG